MAENEVTQALIQYCPVCGYKSKKALKKGRKMGDTGFAKIAMRR